MAGQAACNCGAIVHCLRAVCEMPLVICGCFGPFSEHNQNFADGVKGNTLPVAATTGHGDAGTVR